MLKLQNTEVVSFNREILLDLLDYKIQNMDEDDYDE
jgi:hypothetical protein